MFETSYAPVVKMGYRVLRRGNLVTLAHAKVRKGETHVHTVADRWRPQLKAAFLKAVRRVQDQVQLPELEAAVRAQDERRALAAVVPALEILAAMDLPLMDVLAASARRTPLPGIRVLGGPYVPGQPVLSRPPYTMTFNVTNPKAVAWVKARATELIKELIDREAIKVVIERSFVEGFAPRVAARLIRGALGLTTPQVNAASNLYKRLINAPGETVQAGSKTIRVPFDPSDEFLENVVERYEDRLLNSRAETVAHTESMRASNEGQSALWDQATEVGLLTGDEQKAWIATPDKHVCPICADMEGVTVGLDEPFDFDGEEVDVPPGHPNCRCTIGLVGARAPVEEGS